MSRAEQPRGVGAGQFDIEGVVVARAPLKPGHADLNRLSSEDRPVHQWYRFVLFYPPHLVRTCRERFGLTADDCVLDPFCGTGTTVVECKKQGIPSIGVEANPMVHFAGCTKVDWTPDQEGLRRHAALVARAAIQALREGGIDDTPAFTASTVEPAALRTLSADLGDLLLTDSISGN